MATYQVFFADATSLWYDDDRPESDAEMKAIVASRFFFPPSEIEIERLDGDWIDFTVCFSFEANSSAEIRREAERITNTCGRLVEVFSVLDETGQVVLTEEDLWEPEPT